MRPGQLAVLGHQPHPGTPVQQVIRRTGPFVGDPKDQLGQGDRDCCVQR